MTSTAVIGMLAACAVSVLLTSIVRRIAPRFGLVDRPDHRRKLHGQSKPLGGGVAVLLAVAVVLAVFFLLPGAWHEPLEHDWSETIAFGIACVALVLLGLYDDAIGLRGRQKLLGQVMVALFLAANGLIIRRLGIFSWDVDLGPLALPFTVFWLVGAVNALNLMDGIDGLATTLGIIMCATIGLVAAMTIHPEVSLVAWVFAGSLLGFLWFNFPPATIFLGDAGSMLIGLTVGALAMRSSLKGPGTVLLAAPLAILALPIFDSSVAILRRKLTGRSIYATDRGHLHHCLLDALGSNRKVLASVAICCAVTSAGAVASQFFKNDFVALVSCAATLLMLVATGLFGRGEFLLLAARTRNWGLSFLQPLSGPRSEALQTSVRLQGSRHWETLWLALTESADKLALDSVHLDVNLPAIQEGYHATWERPRTSGPDRRWRIELPLVLGNEPVGRLMVIGQRNGESACVEIERLLELVEPFELRLRDMSGRQSSGQAVDSVTYYLGGNGAHRVPASKLP